MGEVLDWLLLILLRSIGRPASAPEEEEEEEEARTDPEAAAAAAVVAAVGAFFMPQASRRMKVDTTRSQLRSEVSSSTSTMSKRLSKGLAMAVFTLTSSFTSYVPFGLVTATTVVRALS